MSLMGWMLGALVEWVGLTLGGLVVVWREEE